MIGGRFGRWVTGALAVPAVLIAGCKSEGTTNPRIVTLVASSGLGQTGIVGGMLAQPLVVRAVDQNGDPVEGATVFWSVVSGGGLVTPSEIPTGADGQAQANFRLGSALGTQSAQARLQGSQPVTFAATASAAPPSLLTIVGGDNQSATVKTKLPIELAVKVTDAFNNSKEGVTVIFFVTAGGGTLSGATALSGADGIARVEWTLGQTAGTQRVTASVSGVPSVTFIATGRAAAAAKVLIIQGNDQSAPPGATLADSLAVRVTDQFDNPVADVTVTWTPIGDAGQVSPASPKTDVSGRATTSWTLGPTGGPKVVRAAVTGLAPAEFHAAGTVVFVSVSAGGLHTCALDEGGVAYCWGFNGDGQLGLGQVPAGSGPIYPNPQPTAATGSLTFAEVSSGSSHSCATTRLLTNAYCWGKNFDGRLGDGTNTDAKAPVRVSGLQSYQAVSAGRTHSCAVTLGSRLFCWGSNVEGQVGVVLGPIITPDSLAFNKPVAVAPATMFIAAAAGGLHSCALVAAGQAWCWGFNASGQLGNGTTVGRSSPGAVATGIAFAAISAGGQHTCAITAGGAAWCWGAGTDGQLGNGTGANSNVPVLVSGGLSFAAISAGQAHTCGVSTAGVAYCWGRNLNGQLGDNSSTQRNTPVAVGGGFSFDFVTAGENHSCGVTTGRVVYCWGDNQFGQLGDGTQSSRSLPAKVTFQP